MTPLPRLSSVLRPSHADSASSHDFVGGSDIAGALAVTSTSGSSNLARTTQTERLAGEPVAKATFLST